MIIYLTGEGPWDHDRRNLLYIGDSLDQARAIVPTNIRRHEVSPDHFPKRYPYLFAPIPEGIRRKMHAFYSAESKWVSIVSIELPHNP